MKLCLLDANIVIYLHEIGLWTTVTSRFEVFLASTVSDGEVQFWTDRQGQDYPITLDRKQFHEVTASPAELSSLRKRFPGVQLDPGELESLAWLLSDAAAAECRICSSDAAVFKVLGALQESSRGVSLEEMLDVIGQRRRLPWQYTSQFQAKYSSDGLTLTPRP